MPLCTTQYIIGVICILLSVLGWIQTSLVTTGQMPPQNFKSACSLMFSFTISVLAVLRVYGLKK